MRRKKEFAHIQILARRKIKGKENLPPPDIGERMNIGFLKLHTVVLDTEIEKHVIAQS